MEQNPYAKFLYGRDPVAVIAATPVTLEHSLAGLSTEKTNEPIAAGKWSLREIVCHLADCEVVFAYRLRQALATPGHVIQPFDQDIWAHRYGSASLEVALETFLANRKWNLELLKSVAETEHSIPVMHPERGSMTFQTLVETIAGHDTNHLERIEHFLRS